MVSIHGNDVRESAPNPLNLCETALLIADFVNARTKTTIYDIVEEFRVDRKSASQYLRRLWLGGFIGKRARGLFEPAQSSPTPDGHSEDNDHSEHIEDFVDAVDSDNVEDAEQVEDSHDIGGDTPDDIDEFDDTEDTDPAQLVDGKNDSASGFGDIDDTDFRARADDSQDFDDTEQSEDHEDTEDSEDASASGELISGSHSVGASKDNLKVSAAGSCPDCGSQLGQATGKCLKCILERARMRADHEAAAS